MIGRPTGDGTLRFGKAVPRRRDAIDLSFLAVTVPPRGRRSVGSWRKWCGDYRTFATTMNPPRPAARQLDPYSCFHALVSAFRFAQRPATGRQGSPGELFGDGPKTPKLVRNDRSYLALRLELLGRTTHGYLNRLGPIQRSANLAHNQALRLINSCTSSTKRCAIRLATIL